MEDKIYDKFVELSAARANKRVVGDPFDANTEQGPQVGPLLFIIMNVVVIIFGLSNEWRARLKPSKCRSFLVL